MRHLPGLRFFVIKHQTFMAREEINAMYLRNIHANERLHETEAVTNLVDHRLIFSGQWRMLYKLKIPVFRVMEVCKSAVDKRANEVQRERGALMTTHQAAWIGRAFCCCKCWAIHQVAAVRGQCHAVARLHIA